ncbi:MAG: peptidylprolyl isomerase [Candidatus Delongbacteria bacterium]|nr:peptidylprolyl isomerase [Candidatus Delongbacteria bacterium]
MKIRNYPLMAGMLYLGIWIIGCSGDRDSDPVLIRYHEIQIRASQYRDSYFPQLSYGMIIDSDSSRLAYAHQMVRLYASAAKARQAGLDIDTTRYPIYSARRNELILQELMKKEIRSGIPEPNDSLLRQAFYRSNFQYRALLIKENSQAAADSIRNLIDHGHSFETILQTHPETQWLNPSLDSLPWLKWGDLDPLLETELYKLQPGQISPPVHLLTGWFLIKLVQVKGNPMMTEEDYQARKNSLAAKWKRLEENRRADLYIMQKFDNRPIRIRKEAFQIIQHFMKTGNLITQSNREIDPRDRDSLQSLERMIRTHSSMVLARSDGFELTIGEFMDHYINIPKSMKISSVLHSVQCAFRDQYLVEHAMESGLHRQPAVRRKLDNLLNESNAARYSTHIQQLAKPGEADLKTYYDQHRDQYLQQAEIRGYYRHFTRQDSARNFYSQIASLPLQSQTSQLHPFRWNLNPSATTYAKDIPSLLALKLSSLSDQTLSAPFGWQQGFTLFLITERRITHRPLDDIMPVIEPILWKVNYQRLMEDSVYHTIRFDQIKIDTLGLLKLTMTE